MVFPALVDWRQHRRQCVVGHDAHLLRGAPAPAPCRGGRSGIHLCRRGLPRKLGLRLVVGVGHRSDWPRLVRVRCVAGWIFVVKRTGEERVFYAGRSCLIVVCTEHVVAVVRIPSWWHGDRPCNCSGIEILPVRRRNPSHHIGAENSVIPRLGGGHSGRVPVDEVRHDPVCAPLRPALAVPTHREVGVARHQHKHELGRAVHQQPVAGGGGKHLIRGLRVRHDLGHEDLLVRGGRVVHPLHFPVPLRELRRAPVRPRRDVLPQHVGHGVEPQSLLLVRVGLRKAALHA